MDRVDRPLSVGVHDDELDSKPSFYMNMNSKEKGSVVCSMRRVIRAKSYNLPS